jgi:hypothetical protein
MKFPEEYRVDGDINDDGIFIIAINKKRMAIIASRVMGWDHVSASMTDRCPTWPEMCVVKDLFFDEDECVMQLHPPKSNQINNHNYCLHLWSPQEIPIPQPPDILVGIKEFGELFK